MPIFAHIETEKELQLDDRTRLDASKTHYTSNQPAFSKLTIQPGIDEVAYDVFNSVQSRRYLDWEFATWNIDIDSTNDKIDFKEGVTTAVATLTHGTYSLSGLLTEIVTQLNSSSPSPFVYSSSLSVDNEITLSATGDFDLLNATGTNKYRSIINQLYFDAGDLEGSDSYQSSIVESLSKKITCLAGEDIQQIDKVITIADISGSLNNTYFFLYANGNALKFYVWFNVSAGGTDPLLSGHTGIQVNISTNDSANTVASALATAVDLNANFSASSLTNTVLITHASSNWNKTVEDNDTGFTFSLDTAGEAQDSESTYLDIYSINGDNLLCDDADLMQYEPDIRKWVSEGRNSFLNIHRQAQKYILETLDREGYRNINNEKFNKFDLLDKSDFKEWARFTALRMIYEAIKSSQDDVYKAKRETYETKEAIAKNRSIFGLNTNQDGLSDTQYINHTIGLFRS